jgi:hypothetical protein
MYVIIIIVFVWAVLHLQLINSQYLCQEADDCVILLLPSLFIAFSPGRVSIKSIGASRISDRASCRSLSSTISDLQALPGPRIASPSLRLLKQGGDWNVEHGDGKTDGEPVEGE